MIQKPWNGDLLNSILTNMPKIIIHIDFNSYFASVEQQANPFLRGKPIAVGGKQGRLERTVVTTASREAKALGIKTAMSSLQAKRIMPDLIMIQGDPHKYSEITHRFLNILKKHCDSVEQFSTDEAFGDITISAEDYFGAVFVAQMIRREIKEQCGEFCKASIGIGPNKIIAKLASESVKPNGLTVIRPDDVQDFVLSCNLEDVCGIGPRIERRLNEMGISSLQDLLDTPLKHLTNEFKSYGNFLYAIARGLGDDFVNGESVDPKSIGHSYTHAYDLYDESEIQKNLLALCDKVAYRMRRDGFIATHLSVYARYSGFGGVGTQKRFKEPMEDGLMLHRAAWSLLDNIRDQNLGIRLLGISASGLIKTKMPESLMQKDQKTHKVLIALDKIQARFGSKSWQRAATLGTVFKERSSGWHYDHEM